MPYNVTSPGLVGCSGTNGGHGEPGGPGSPGQPGGQISSTNSALTIIGGFSPNGPMPIPLVRQSSAGVVMAERAVRVATSMITVSTGGAGGAGGAGGDLTVRFGGTFVPDQSTGSGDVRARHEFRPEARAAMADINDRSGIYEKVAGDGGAGGSGGSVTLVASGAIARAYRRCAGAVGRGGWRRWRRFIHKRRR